MNEYLKLYNTKQLAVDDTTVVAPNVTFCRENKQVLIGGRGLTLNTPMDIVYDGPNKLKYFEADYLTFTCISESGGISMSHNGFNASRTKPNIEYKLNDNDWVTWTGTTTGTYDNIPLVAGDVVKMRGNNIDGLNHSVGDFSKFTFASNSKIEASGSIMSLIDECGAESEVPNEYCFYKLFYQTNGLTTSPNLTATIQKQNCYAQMFRECSDLKSVILPYGITNIEASSFYNCTSLTSITIPNSVININNYAFYNCELLPLITIPNDVVEIGQGAFSNCKSLPSFDIPNGITTIKSGVFSGCESLTSVTIPNNVTSIGDSAFYSCTSLSSITIPNSVTSIGHSAFFNCSAINSISIPYGINTISHSLFWGCTSLSSITIPNTVTSINSNAFRFCRFSTITLPDNLITIGNGAFSVCRYLNSITIPNSVTSIGEQAFETCDLLTSITIPSSVTSIGEGVCSGCWNLTSINVDPNNQYYTSVNGILFDINQNTLIQYPIKHSITTYVIPNTVTRIGDNAFYLCHRLVSITIPDSVTSIGNSAFVGCNSLPVENNLRYADTYLVEATDKTLSSYVVRDGTKWIGTYSLGYLTNATAITIPSSVVFIENFSIYNNNKLCNIEIPNNVITVGNYAFQACSALSSVTIGSSVTNIGAYAFNADNKITTMTCSAIVPPSCGDYCLASIPTTIPVYVPADSISAYQSASQWSRFTNIQPIP